MKSTLFIKSLVFGLVFTAVMSVSFLVEAHDVPDGVQAYAAAPAEVFGPPLPTALPIELTSVADGMASWYGDGFQGRRTASGSRFNKSDYTAAHKTLPFGSLLRVENENTGQVIVVEVTDRGPFIKRRVVDLSQGAARKIGVSVTPVLLGALTPEDVREFYTDNDSAVIVVTQDMMVQSRKAVTFVRITAVSSFTDAVVQATGRNVIVVLPDGQGGTDFAVGEPHPVDVAMAAR